MRILQWTVAFLQRDRKFSISALMQSTAVNAVRCGECESAFNNAFQQVQLLSSDRASKVSSAMTTTSAMSRPDSSMSVSSVATTSCSVSISESDSGIEFGGKSTAGSRPTSVHYFNESPARGSFLVSPVWPDLVKFWPLWGNFISLWQFFEG